MEIGPEALDALDKSSYNLVLMNIQMPEMDGLTARGNTKDLKLKFNRIPTEARMATPDYPASAMAATRLTVGSVLNRSFSTLMKNPTVFFGLPLIALVPITLIDVLLPDSLGIGLGIQIVKMILNLVIQAAMTYGVFQILRNQTSTLGESVSHGMANLGPLILAAILSFLGIILGTLLFIIPGIIISCMWSVTIPVCVIERLGAIESIKRSERLTNGYRWPIFGLVMILNLAIWFVIVLAGVIVVIVTENMVISTLAAGLAASIVLALNNVMIATIYFDLRAIKEGISIDNLANVFD